MPHSFSTNCVLIYHILPLEQTEETRPGTLPGYKYYQHKIHSSGSGPHMTNFKVLLKRYHKDTLTLNTTYNVECSCSRNNCLHYAQLSPHEIN
jgi:hypothetical protein